MTRMRGRGERGFGLLLVVVVLALLGFLALSAFEIARREFRSAHELGYSAEAFEAAESGLAAAASMAAGFQGAPMLVPQLGPGVLGDHTRFATTAVRLTPSIFLLRSVGERLDGAGEVLARRALGLTGKLLTPPGSSTPRFTPLHSHGWVQLY